MNEESNFKQSSSLGLEISCSAVSTGTQECLSTGRAYWNYAYSKRKEITLS